MRGRHAALLLVPLALAAALAWSLGLFGTGTPPEAIEPAGVAPPTPTPPQPPAPEVAAPAARSGWSERVAVARRDEGPPPQREGQPWQEQRVVARAAPGAAWTGSDLLATISEHLFVRAGSAEDLEALRALTLAPKPPADPMSLPMAVRRLEQAGWRVVVQDPVLLITRAPPGQGPQRPR